MRADARRNRVAMLDAARALIAEVGVDFTMDSLAGRAGVAVGTLYRHYPTKTDLVAAVLDEAVTGVAEIAEEGERAVTAGAPAGPTLEAIFVRVADSYASDAAVKHAAAQLGLATDPAALIEEPDGAAHRATRSFATILAAAQDSGHIRLDLTLADLIMLIGSAPDPTNQMHARSRYLAIVLSGMRPSATPDPVVGAE